MPISDLYSNQLTKVWDAIKNYFVTHPTLGWVLFVAVLSILFLVYITKALPIFDILKARLLKPVAGKIKFKKIVKAAIKYDIRGKINREVSKLKEELPKDWINEIDLKWVEQETKEDFLNDDEIVVKVRPISDQRRNLANVLYLFLRKSFFPKVKKVVPEIYREASVLYMAHRIICNYDVETTKIFEDFILEPVVDKKGKIVEIYDMYSKIDKRGYFSGPFLREIQEISERARFTAQRKIVAEETKQILDQLAEFDNWIQKKDKKGDMPSEKWYRPGKIASYGFILVARPYKVRFGVNQYVNRAIERENLSVERLYILGSSQESNFAERVAKAIEEKTDYTLKEKFLTQFDYRGDKSGVCYLFVK
jgi:hypothetical protein